MPKFDKRFVNFMWDDELKGKEEMKAKYKLFLAEQQLKEQGDEEACR